MMNKAEQEEIDDLANMLCYERIKHSPLWHQLDNDVIDAKAGEMATAIKARLETLIEAAEALPLFGEVKEVA
jgi:hypothetical protein